MSTNMMNIPMSTHTSTITSILIRTKSTVMSILTHTIMNTRISTAMSMTTKGKPMCTIMSTRVNTESMIISIPGMRKSCTSIKIQRRNS